MAKNDSVNFPAISGFSGWCYKTLFGKNLENP